MSVVGFTGTQRGVTPAQFRRLCEALGAWPRGEFHHGDCVGADASAHDIACALGYRVVIHPPTNDSKRAYCAGAAVVLPPRGYLLRNGDIVDASEVMVATPGELSEQLRSGTWATIRRARRAERPMIIIYPDGTTMRERWPG